MNTEAAADTLLGGRVRLHQPARGYRVAIDPVLLAAAVDARAGCRVLDVGCGVGAAALCLIDRVPKTRIDGLESMAEFAALARRNARLNGAEDWFKVHVGDLTAPPDGLSLGEYDFVMTNPPYLSARHGHPPADPLALAAERESTADLRTWVKFCVRAVTNGGQLTFIHRSDRASELSVALAEAGCGQQREYSLWPTRRRVGAKRVIVRSVKGASAAYKAGDGLVLHNSMGDYTESAHAILRDGQPIEF